MALHFLLRVNGEAIGLVNIRRLHDLVPGQPSEYEVHAEYPAGQKHEARVMHDYDDGALVLTQKAIAALVNTTDPVAEAEARGYQRAIDALRGMGRIFEVPDELLHAVDLGAPGRFGFGINDSSEVADICRRVVLGAAERLEAIAGEPANQTAGETDA